MSNPADIVLIYTDQDGGLREQPLTDVAEVGPLVDSETWRGLDLSGWRFAEGQDYVLVDGGLVQNDPALPVFDLDVLDSDDFDQATVSEVVDLYDRIAAHPAASADWPSALERAADIVREHGAPEDVDLIQKKEATRLGGPDLRAETPTRTLSFTAKDLTHGLADLSEAEIEELLEDLYDEIAGNGGGTGFFDTEGMVAAVVTTPARQWTEDLTGSVDASAGQLADFAIRVRDDEEDTLCFSGVALLVRLADMPLVRRSLQEYERWFDAPAANRAYRVIGYGHTN